MKIANYLKIRTNLEVNIWVKFIFQLTIPNSINISSLASQ
ncbi:hypothetical protein PSP6_630018 [Paraburkholderia tropica]|nr:hypothetical protein PSP6_630018 [Paraburkholderia tropica]